MEAATPTGDPGSPGGLGSGAGHVDLNRIFGALSDPTRRGIIIRLTRGEATLSELAEPFDLTMPGLSKHVTVLQRAGIIDKWRQGRSHYCRLRPRQLAAADEWLRTQTGFWEDRLDGLATFLEDGTADAADTADTDKADAEVTEDQPT